MSFFEILKFSLKMEGELISDRRYKFSRRQFLLVLEQLFNFSRSLYINSISFEKSLQNNRNLAMRNLTIKKVLKFCLPPCFHQIFWRMKNMKMGDSLCFHDCTHTKAFLIIFLIKHKKNISFPYRRVKLVNHFEIECLVVCIVFCLCSVCRCVISSIKKDIFSMMHAGFFHLYAHIQENTLFS